MGDVLLKNGLVDEGLLLRNHMEAMRDAVLGIDIALDVILLGAFKPGADLFEIVLVMVFENAGGSELIGNPSMDQEVDRFFDVFHLEVGRPDRQGIFLFRVFDVHRHIVDQALLHRDAKHFRPRAIRIKLDDVSQFFDLGQFL